MFRQKRSVADHIFEILKGLFLASALILVLYPLYFIVIASFSDPVAINNGEISLLPVGFNLLGYQRIFENADIWNAYGNTVFYTVVGTFVNLCLTMIIAYPLSREDFVLQKPLTLFLMFTLYFQGGLIPTYLWISRLGLYNTRWVMIILPAINVFFVIIARTNIKHNIPEELYEAAIIDGCDHFTFFGKIIVPLSRTILVVLTLYYGVNHWNEFMNGLIYLRDKELMPLQVTLRGILLQNQVSALGDVDSMLEQQKAAELIKYGVIIVSSLPVLVVYPFVQKHFEKGVMIGAVKG